MDHFWGSASRKINATPRLSHVFPSQLSSSLCHSHCPFSNVELHYDQVGTRCGAGLKLGHVPGNLPSLPFCPPEQARECTLTVRGSPGFAYPFCQFHWSSKQPRGLLFPEPDSRAGAPSVCLTCSLPGEGLCLCNLYSPESLSRGAGPNLITCLPFLPDSICIYRSLSASLQLVLSENCSTWKCILDVFMEWTEFWDLLLCHLAQWTGVSLLYQWLLCPTYRVSDPINLGWGLITGIYNRFSGNADASGIWAILWHLCVRVKIAWSSSLLTSESALKYTRIVNLLPDHWKFI